MKLNSTSFGVPKAFELIVDATSSAARGSRLARAAFVIGGLRLGADQLFDVCDIFDRLLETASYNGKREHCEIFAMPADLAFKGISRVLLGLSGDEEDFAGGQPLERFKLWFHSTLGDCWPIVVTCRGKARVLFTASDGAPIQEVFLPAEAVESALRQAVEHLRLMQPFH